MTLEIKSMKLQVQAASNFLTDFLILFFKKLTFLFSLQSQIPVWKCYIIEKILSNSFCKLGNLIKIPVCEPYKGFPSPSGIVLVSQFLPWEHPPAACYSSWTGWKRGQIYELSRSKVSGTKTTIIKWIFRFQVPCWFSLVMQSFPHNACSWPHKWNCLLSMIQTTCAIGSR